ncbi:uncharacterized protein NECHADRAFT_46300 [Fusarium vanettenii 77-13-4]|uniref:FAD-binding PCMH-type domain-containing protein n=1 Tax=Fusarium vanettenii (strain ATCC MYA-4622 / CBS 123669 / FGSC 9596 / NRRL 45880 / 77-13-4) TaxID=660122 RepID=C7Z3T3_FUSV7|nr:uncharacterized protein NECHADRAFT_46300 [Fusarium vanettenii 77-13-4]EEU41190.1 hypothetical protein NECHADRAFT_46300 [Fusarium vanettenii 77-13-4]
MATLDTLKRALRKKAKATPASSDTQELSDLQYFHGLNLLAQGSSVYQDFIAPQLALLLAPLNSDSPISVLEIGPGPKSVLGHLPDYLRKKVERYEAFEPSELFLAQLEDWFTGSPLPRLESPPDIHPIDFHLNNDIRDMGKFDLILFCHSMYGIKLKRDYIKQALEMLTGRGIIAIFHRENLHFADLVCHKTASFPNGVTRVLNEVVALDYFAPLIAGFDMRQAPSLRLKWHKICRALGRQEGEHLLFSSPEIMITFNKHATALPKLMALVPSIKDKTVKNREANVHQPAAIMRPKNVQHVQQCVEWAREHKIGLAIVGGGHSGHCLQPNAVSVDMSAFDKLHILKGEGFDLGSLIVAEAGCKTGDIIQKTMEKGLTVPLGSRPTVGAGLWLQGGIGHLSRLHGLACDAIVGAVVVSVGTGKVLCIGNVPSQHQPTDAVRPDEEEDLLWALKGAGTNLGIVVKVTFMAHAASTYLVKNWIPSLTPGLETQFHLDSLNVAAKGLPRECSVDGYLFYQDNELRLGVTTFDTEQVPRTPVFGALFGPEIDSKLVNGVELFDNEMYMSKMHGGHGGGKTSSFKRCIFLKGVGDVKTADILVDVVKNRPSPLCYLHLLHGGEAVSDVAETATAFGCRDWMFVCVITAVWPCDQDGTATSRGAVQWVYDVAEKLLPLSAGAYGADLGPDPRDKALAAWAFGPNRTRLAELKQRLDPDNVLAYACPLLKAPKQKLVILVTGESGSGKDYCADIWASVFTMSAIRARTVSISDETKQGYAAATGSDLRRLLSDRDYKEEHRPALTEFFQEQLKKRSELLKEHFLKAMKNLADVDVLMITGMRDEAPLVTFSPLFPDIKMIEVRVQTSQWIRRIRRGGQDDSDSSELKAAATFTFNNDTDGDEKVKSFAKRHLLPFFHEDLERLAGMVPTIPDYPTPVDFRHVLNIVSSPNGLTLCTSLFETHFSGDWTKVDAIASCEAGGFLLASPLAQQLDKPMIPIRKAGKLPPPVVLVSKSSSHISSLAEHYDTDQGIEMNPDLVSEGMSVVVVDDVLATGKTLCAVLRLLCEAGARVENINVMVVAEFPYHDGRGFLQKEGFEGVNIQSLLVFAGA